ncbi:MAG: hypothetical protein SPJ69_08400 [Campylobacter sp.]|uniref:hypothetical protein n=1 Tax=Campylobacter sp. TaxID=205 RepID=UPI0029731BE4|nr:hypothetical protein [Campylobacter sp.]MDD7600429.1 hypothetical protein [Campylobacteraceae bacterium]MDY5888321.1 hypothetical protein [Campylobacter sp.]
MKKMIFLALAMVIFGGCGKANSTECPDTEYQQVRGVGTQLKMRARDDISIHNIIINRGNCLYTLSVFSGFYRNGVDRIQSGGNPLTSDYIEQSIKEKYREEYYKELNAGPKKLAENIDLKFGEEGSIWLSCKPLEVVFETNLGQCEYKFD